jgi:type IV pilus assembly protein PilF
MTPAERVRAPRAVTRMFTIDSGVPTGYSPKPANSLGPPSPEGCRQARLTFALKASAFLPCTGCPPAFLDLSLASRTRSEERSKVGSMARCVRNVVSGDLAMRSPERARCAIADRRARRPTARCWLAGFAALTMLGCTHGGRGANGADSERQSESEYDVARDMFLRAHDARGALAHVQKAIELNDQNAEAYHFEALVYLYFCAVSPPECRLPEADRAARRAVDLKPDLREAKNTLGVVLIQEKRYDEAVSVLQPLANDILYQTPWDAWGNLGLAYLEKGKPDDAIAALRRSVAAEPKFCVGNYRLGLAYEKKGDLTAAREAFSRAVETNRPECQALQDAFEARARVYSKSKNCDQAKGDLEKCKEISADSPAGQRCLASLKSSPC